MGENRIAHLYGDEGAPPISEERLREILEKRDCELLSPAEFLNFAPQELVTAVIQKTMAKFGHGLAEMMGTNSSGLYETGDAIALADHKEGCECCDKEDPKLFKLPIAFAIVCTEEGCDRLHAFMRSLTPGSN